jgi:hypothetical protein
MTKLQDAFWTLVYGLILVLFLSWITDAFAMDLSDVNQYTHKNSIITYKEDGRVVSNFGQILYVLDNKEDYTLDRIYNYKA